MKKTTIQNLFREIKGSTLINKKAYKTIEGSKLIRHDLKLNIDSFYGFKSMTIHYSRHRIATSKTLKKISKICFTDGDRDGFITLCEKLGVTKKEFSAGKAIFYESYGSYFCRSDKEMLLCGGISNETGSSEISCCFKNITNSEKNLHTISDLAEKELLSKINLSAKIQSQFKMAECIESIELLKESKDKGKHYMLYNYFPSLPKKGEGFHSIYQTQQNTFINVLETLDFFYGPKKEHWIPNNSGNIKEIFEYNGKHNVKWIHSVRKLICPEMIFFIGTSLIPRKRPIVELKTMYSRS